MCAPDDVTLLGKDGSGSQELPGIERETDVRNQKVYDTMANVIDWAKGLSVKGNILLKRKKQADSTIQAYYTVSEQCTTQALANDYSVD